MGLADNIKKLCINAGTSIGAIERELGFGKGTVYRWNEIIPSADKVQRVADYFGVSIDSLMGREEPDEDVWEVRERLRTQPGMRLLFDATSKATPEELEAVANMFIAMRGNRDE